MVNNFFITYNYMLPLFLALIVGCYLFICFIPKKELNNSSVPIDNLLTPFTNDLSNQLYEFSFKPPFVWFMPEDPNSKAALRMDNLIARANMSQVMNFRVLNTIQTLLMILAVFVTIVFGFIVQNSAVLIKFFFNFEVAADSQNVIFLLIGGIMMIASFAPKMYVISKARSLENDFYTNLPILQQFILIMLKSNRSIGEVYNVLANSEMPYNEIFRMANNIYIRDREASADYLAGVFYGTPFYETVLTLKSYNDYGTEQSIESLERRRETIISEVQSMKKSKGVIKGLITEGSIILPFSAIMLLGLFPVIWWSIQMLNEAMSFQ